MPNVWLLTDIRYTKEASRFLKEASLVVGTGRGAMESVVSERSVAVYSESHDVPVLVNSAEVFNQSLNMNFSLRNNLGFVDADTNLKNLIVLLNNRSYQDQVLDFLKSRKDEFDMDEVVDDYLKSLVDDEIITPKNKDLIYKTWKQRIPKIGGIPNLK